MNIVDNYNTANGIEKQPNGKYDVTKIKSEISM